MIFHEGKYTVRPMDPSWDSPLQKRPTIRVDAWWQGYLNDVCFFLIRLMYRLID